MRISDWSSDVCSSDLQRLAAHIIAFRNAEEIDAPCGFLGGARAAERHHGGQRRQRGLRHARLHFLALDHDFRRGIVERLGEAGPDEPEGDAVPAHLVAAPLLAHTLCHPDARTLCRRYVYLPGLTLGPDRKSVV